MNEMSNQATFSPPWKTERIVKNLDEQIVAVRPLLHHL
jgi:hypothetical protein